MRAEFLSNAGLHSRRSHLQLDVAVKFSRACQNGAQRLFHIRRLGEVALEAGTATDQLHLVQAFHTRQASSGLSSSASACARF